MQLGLQVDAEVKKYPSMQSKQVPDKQFEQKGEQIIH